MSWIRLNLIYFVHVTCHSVARTFTVEKLTLNDLEFKFTVRKTIGSTDFHWFCTIKFKKHNRKR